MAAITGTALAVGSAAYMIANAEKQKKDSKRAISEVKRQDLVNPFEDVAISTEKSDQQTDAALSSMATSVDALQRGGTRAILGGMPRLQESNILLQNIISADLDEKAKARDMAIAQGEVRNQAIQENREQLAIQGLGQQLQTARQDSATGITNLLSGVLAGSSAINSQNSLSNPQERELQFKTSNYLKPSAPIGANGIALNQPQGSLASPLIPTNNQYYPNPDSPFFYERQAANYNPNSIFPQNNY